LQSSSSKVATRTAKCCCGALKVRVTGSPRGVYACSCLECQKASGSAFTYIAVFPVSETAIEGEYRSWRRSGDFGRWVESSFCPVCGAPVFGRSEAVPDVIQVSAGCFADPEFERPSMLYWGARKHDWLSLPTETEILDRQ
jgi:hypothetical protein